MKERFPFNADDALAEYFTRGWYRFTAEAIMSQIPIDSFKVVTEKHPDNCFHAEGFEFHSAHQAAYITAFQNALKELYLDKLDECDLVFDFFTDSVNGHVQKFHSDAQYAMPGQNATVNCFFDSMNPIVGGEFRMTPYTDDLEMREALSLGMYPQKFDIFIFNQNRNFLHRATKATVPRRMLSFACAFKSINPIHPNFTT